MAVSLTKFVGGEVLLTALICDSIDAKFPCRHRDRPRHNGEEVFGVHKSDEIPTKTTPPFPALFRRKDAPEHRGRWPVRYLFDDPVPFCQLDGPPDNGFNLSQQHPQLGNRIFNIGWYRQPEVFVDHELMTGSRKRSLESDFAERLYKIPSLTRLPTAHDPAPNSDRIR